jgi:hypothetical protein
MIWYVHVYKMVYETINVRHTYLLFFIGFWSKSPGLMADEFYLNSYHCLESNYQKRKMNGHGEKYEWFVIRSYLKIS